MEPAEGYKIKRANVSDQIYTLLKQKIIDKEWAPGEKIPSTSEIAKTFGVSRLSARTAMQRLSALGLIDIRVGDGTYVKEYPLDELIGESSELMMSIQMQDDMSEFRDYFEYSYMIIACQRRTDEDIKKASEYLRQMTEAANRGDLEGYLKYDACLHKSCCMMTRNQYFILAYKLMEKTIVQNYRDNTEACSKLPENSLNVDDDNYYLKVLCRGHQSYIDALIQRNADIARKYLDPYLDVYKENRHQNS